MSGLIRKGPQEPYEVWNTTTWTLVGADFSEMLADHRLQRAKRKDRGSEFVVLKRQPDNTLVYPHQEQNPNSGPVRKQLEALDMPKLPGWEKL
jgi:hypothetical protein